MRLSHARSVWKKVLTLAIGAGALPLALWAEKPSDFVNKGISYSGATATYAGDELILSYTAGDEPGELSIRSDLKVEARVLVVAGGGAGGTIKAATSLGGGGGGAGGVILLGKEEVYQLPAANYRLTVGRGGGAATVNDVNYPGTNGTDSVVQVVDGAELFRAFGGGGGGASGPGVAGGSGGGGGAKGYAGAEALNGGAQGNNGGAGKSSSSTAGGGGGYGTAGGATDGGSGLTTDISGATKAYAAGGGGGKTGTSGEGGAGGSDIGGAGGSAGQNGADATQNTGSGGGGGGKNTFGGAGADGIIIIRIKGVYETKVDLPEAVQLPWSGREQTGFVESIKYVLVSGTTEATKTGSYTYRVKPAEGFTWRDTDGTEEREITWKIVPVEVDKPVATTPTAEYTGSDHNAGIAFNVGYTLIEGVTNAVNAATYSYTFALANTADSTNYVWKGVLGADEKLAPVSGSWTITPCSVEKPAIRTDLVFGNSNQVAVVLHGDEHFRLQDGGTTNATDVGDYNFTLVLDNPANATNYVWADAVEYPAKNDPFEAAWSIAKAPNAILKLSIVGWRVGSNPNTPQASATWGYPLYAWATSKTAPEEEWTDWNTAKPTEVGNYFLRARVPEAPNWFGAEAVQSFIIWDSPETLFTDHVAITITNKTGALQTDYPVRLEFSESALLGFSYDRARRDGFAFISGSEMLDYKIVTWNPDGTSFVWVKIPRLRANESLTIEMWWHLREDQQATGETDFATPTTLPDVAPRYGLVIRDGERVNGWKVKPSVSPQHWELSDPPAELTVTKGELLDGTAISNYFYFVNEPTVMLSDLSQFTNAGRYRAVFRPENAADYAPLEESIEILVSDHTPYSNIGGTNGDSGRVLLMNRDSNKACPIDRQGVKDTSASQSTYWDFLDTTGLVNFPTGDDVMHLQNGTNSILRKKDGQMLWHLMNCRHGNTFPNDDNAALKADQVYLPWESSTAYSFERRDQRMDRRARAGTVVMQNLVGASIVSSCFTGGVGVVYFDAANGWTSVKGEEYQLRVEYVTETQTEQPPTDEFSGDGEDLYKNLEGHWKPVKKVILFKRDGTSDFVEETVYTNTFRLAITNGGTDQNFYRVVVPINSMETMRVRIVRETKTPSTTFGPDNGGLILFDNIIVSYPAMSADLEPTGLYDIENPDKRGKQMLGQELATTVPFPSIGQAGVYGRAKAISHVNSGAETDPDTFILSAKMHYRWRYLNQHIDSEFKEVDLNPLNGFKSNTPLELPATEGDIEFWYDANLCAPYYVYVDYSGLGKGVPYSEEISVVTNRLASAATQPSAGNEWFFRLRTGESLWEGVRVELRGVEGFAPSYPMELSDDGMWRALVMIPTNAAGVCSFAFVGENLQTAGATDLAQNETIWTGGSLAATNSVPANGTLVPTTEGGELQYFAVDHNANYLEFQVSPERRTWSVSRAQYQNFNHWHDAYTRVDAFQTSFPSNGVNDVAMTTSNLDMSDWDLFNAEATKWNEDFYLADHTDPGFPRDEVFSSHATPRVWNAYNLSFVSTELVANRAETIIKRGTAAKLLGQSQGSIVFTKADCPKGLEKVTVKARLGQSMTFDSFSYNQAEYKKQNYMFVVPTTMSQNVPKNDALGDMAVGASVSLVGYYRAAKGCYEFRVERCFSGSTYRLSLYKWSFVGGAITPVCLCAQDFGNMGDNQLPWSNEPSPSDGRNGFVALGLSLKNTPSGTEIICTCSQREKPSSNGQDLSTFYGDGTKAHNGLRYIDTAADRLTQGSYGVAAKDCPAQFMMPFHIDTPFEGAIEDGGDTELVRGGKFFNGSKNKLTFPAVYSSDIVAIRDGDWELVPGRSECYTNRAASIYNTWTGLRTPTNLKQTLDVYLQSREDALGTWRKFGSVNVSSYGFPANGTEIPLHLTGEWNLMLKTGSYNVDVVVSDIRQAQWQAPNHEDLNYLPEDFVYTQGLVLMNETARRREIVLQPSRARDDKAVSIRSPVLHGLGKVSFSYDLSSINVNTEVWLQMATNNVEYALAGEGGYNESIKSVDEGEDEPIGTWVTIGKYKKADLDANRGTITKYLGYHDQPDAPVTGLFRVFIPPEIVTRAGIAATNRTQNINYGKITITGMTVSDEPGLSEDSWFGYNLRTIGDTTDTEKRMYLTDTTLTGEMSGTGLDLALNNSIAGVPEADRERARAYYPSIISPTFKGQDGCVGTVRFKARLYSTTGRMETGNPGRVVIYGASNSVRGEWKVLSTNLVTSSVFQEFSWESKGDKYYAVKLEVTSPKVRSSTTSAMSDVDRVILDEVIVGEKVQPSLSFVYVRPFRQNLTTVEPIEDIMSPNEQPLLGESWGVQVQLALKQLTDEIDTNRGFKVSFTYQRGERPWGYDAWKNSAMKPIELVQVGNPADLIFRSVADTPDSLVEPPTETSGSQVVQYQIIVKYYDWAGTTEYVRILESKNDWQQPSWYQGVDLNAKYGGDTDPAKFAGYTILDTVSPGRAWINEVNFNDGTVSENDGETVVDHQFIEVCVPSEVDMSGWFLRLTDMNQEKWVMAKFGTGELIPAVKHATVHEREGFEFVVVESPETNLAGGIRDEDNKPVADATWSLDGIPGTADSGTLSFSRPFQFELVRPSGIVEHQFVLGGTNTYASKSYGYKYEATNLLATLNREAPSSIRFLVGDELSRLDDRARFASAGVMTGSADANPAPGAEGTWSNKLAFTPGRINIDQGGAEQVIPEGWFLAPNGTNCWVRLSTVGSHLRQVCGGETNAVIRFVVPQGVSTNIVYEVDPWYELASLTVDGQVVAEHEARFGNSFTYTLSPTNKNCEVVATEGFDSGLEGLIDMKGPYASSIVRWLNDKWPGQNPANFRPAVFKELGEDDEEELMSLQEMYYLDIPPFNEENAERVWWVRAGIINPLAEKKIRTRKYAAGDITYENAVIEMKMYLSNDVTKVASAPCRLQGLDYARSDEATGRWTSESFQILGKLDNGQSLNKGYLPFRSFYFTDGSFDETTYISRIEILDPFSTESPGYGYGWNTYPKTIPFYFKWTITTNSVPGTVEVLRKNSTYDSGF